ncbi:hypothetical protein KC867_01255 [Candidatus Saccharibacteria bacterium]|nr:hypothetical protein [Candidatus Saccharibacteria bacterium]
MSESLSNKAKTLDRYIMNLPMSKSMNTMSRQEQVAMLDLRDGASMLRVAVTKYFASDDLDEKRIALEDSVGLVKDLDVFIIEASKLDLLGPVDVAHLSALADSIRERLE